jgi:predicted DNA-binding protein (MmcQ/YjbR family)
MDNERLRTFCLSLPHTTETLNWGHVLVYWVGDRDLGGKMFAMANAEGVGGMLLAFPAAPEDFYELLELDGIYAEPHLARARWVALERWNALTGRQIEEKLAAAHALTYEKLSRRAKAVLAMPKKEQARLLRERRKELAAAGKLRSSGAFGRKH